MAGPASGPGQAQSTPEECLVALRGMLNEKQFLAATETLDTPLMILAGGGSGKTFTVAARVAYMISQGVPPPSILGLTFSKKAAGELKERVEKLCHVIFFEKKNCSISTFFSFIFCIIIHFFFHLSLFTM